MANARVHSSTACDFAVVVVTRAMGSRVVFGGSRFGFGVVSRTAKKSFIVGSGALRLFDRDARSGRDARSKYSSVDPAVDERRRSLAANASRNVV